MSPLRRPLLQRLGELLGQHAKAEAPLLLAATAALDAALQQGHVCCPLAAIGPDAEAEAGTSGARPAAAAGAPGRADAAVPAALTHTAADALARSERLRQRLLATGVVAAGLEPPAALVVDEQHRLYLRRHFAAEQRLAAALRARLGLPPLPLAEAAAAALRAAAPALAAGETDWQGIAALAALRSRFAVITGGPGTGKTTTVARLLQAVLAASPTSRVALCAPTGKAAARLGEAVRQRLPQAALTASTLHRLLGYLPLPDAFRHGPDRLLPYDLVVVDEASMVDLELMAALLAALPADARLLLLGDQDQLASVAAGQVLGDLCRAAGTAGGVGKGLAAAAAAVFGTAPPVAGDGPLADVVVALQRNYRFAAQPGLSAFAAAARRGDAAAALAALQHGHQDLDFAALPAAAAALLPPFADAILGLLRADSPAAALQKQQRLRILCATRHGPFGVEALNEAVEQLLQQHGHRTTAPFYRGRPLLVTANDHKNGLYNGDLGVAWPDADGRPMAFFGRGDGVRAVLPLRLPPHETAWAMTVHKSQGSEFDEVLLVLPETDGPLLHAPLLYTAVTRARARAVVRGDRALVEAALQRQPWRRTGLVDALLAP